MNMVTYMRWIRNKEGSTLLHIVYRGCISGWHTQERRDSAKDIAFSHDSLENIDSSITLFIYAINGRDREGWHPICQDGGVSSLEEHAQLPPQMPHCLLLLLP